MRRRSASPRWLVGNLLVLIAAQAMAVNPAPEIGLATSMDKVMIEGGRLGFPFEGWIANSVDLSLARREHEAFQVVVMPDRDLTNVTVTVSTLTKTGSTTHFNGTTDVCVVGHVDVDDYSPVHYPSYLITYRGWWPDALLTFQQSCNVNSGDHVSFWVNVGTLPTTEPGDYTGTVTVSAYDTTPTTLPLNVHVWDFELPFRTTIETAFSSQTLDAQRIYGNQWSTSMLYKMYDVLLEHRVSPVELYRTGSVMPFEYIQYCAARGGNAFCLGKVPDLEPRKFDTLVAQLKAAGLFDMSFVYGFDEVNSEKFVLMADTFNAIHARHPGLRTATTARDYTFGASPETSFLREPVDIWVPTIDRFNASEAVVLRSEGKDMWWYNCVWPIYPYPNWFIECPAIEARLMMGAMAYKYKPAGHLYWAVAHWINNSTPIGYGPYTSWNPRSEAENGDGSIILPGPYGPIPTLRLANIRDGLEDYEYLKILQDKVDQVTQLEPTPEIQAFLTSANAILVIPAAIVTSTTSYTRQSSDLADFRAQVADAIAQAELILNPPPHVDGDVDGDLDVDNTDCLMVQSAMDTSQGQPGFLPEADFDADGTITCNDAAIWLGYYRAFVGDPAAADPCSLTTDADGDTVPDCVDQCPGTPTGIPVDETGCPLPPPADFDGDFDVDMDDYAHLQACFSGANVPQTLPECQDANLDGDAVGDVDSADRTVFLGCLSGPNRPADLLCAN